MVVYKITNIINGKFYIGSTNNYKRRVRAHISKLNQNKHSNSLLQRAWLKYKEDNFVFKVIEIVNTNLLEREQYYLDSLKPYDKSIGYNILKDTGFTWQGCKHSKATIIKMRECKKGNLNPMFGKGKHILQFDKNGKFLKEFVSVREASEFLNLRRKRVKKKNRERFVYVNTSLRKCLKGERPTAYGFKWKYKPT